MKTFGTSATNFVALCHTALSMAFHVWKTSHWESSTLWPPLSSRGRYMEQLPHTRWNTLWSARCIDSAFHDLQIFKWSNWTKLLDLLLTKFCSANLTGPVEFVLSWHTFQALIHLLTAKWSPIQLCPCWIPAINLFTYWFPISSCVRYSTLAWCSWCIMTSMFDITWLPSWDSTVSKALAIILWRVSVALRFHSKGASSQEKALLNRSFFFTGICRKAAAKSMLAKHWDFPSLEKLSSILGRG